ncbi:protein of unknown function [Vreelandella subterranea]|uniref:DUF4376 domain-containing protein n=1 Tax=Vreelandella subterranea TaxID=416874 RepID=A0A1H9UIL2_9GAMM|nr:DUF4376 domain-containing protein [Halomonas subterranea]SES09285.1 protein of unknown function [Halomonas subterranea]
MRIYDINPNDDTIINPKGRPAPIDPMRRTPRIPQGATISKPPTTSEHEAARWSHERWEVVPDWRGHVYWTEDGQRHEITELGIEPPEDALNEAPPMPLSDLAEQKRREINTARDTELVKGLPYEIAGEQDVVQTRPQDQINLLGLRAKAEAAREEGITEQVMKFRGQKNVTRYLTPNDMYALTTAALAHIEEIYDHSWERKDAIKVALEAEDRDGIEAVEWNGNQP